MTSQSLSAVPLCLKPPPAQVTSAFKRFFHGYCELQLSLSAASASAASASDVALRAYNALFELPLANATELRGRLLRCRPALHQGARDQGTGDQGEACGLEMIEIPIQRAGSPTLRLAGGRRAVFLGDSAVTALYRRRTTSPPLALALRPSILVLTC